MTLIGFGGDIGKTFPAVVARVNREVGLDGTTFASHCRVRLSPAEFNQLLDQGYCFHKCPNGKDLLVTFRAQELSPAYIQANLDVFDLQAKELVGITDFQVFPTEKKATMHEIVIMPQAGFTEDAQRVLVDAGFTAEELQPWNFQAKRWYRPTGNAARLCLEGGYPLGAWVKRGYRQKDNAGYGDIFQTLVRTAVEVSKGLGVSSFMLKEVGEEDTPGRDRLMAHYAAVFGAEVHGHPLFGNMEIKI
ncbi:MAG: hypothetical protein NT099_03260 [Candidatus Saganbacteria bacterium]|nr:hypothetical protein [Candidatus Saganbacteria bacterium]